jgi:acyl-CoA dehydrogenase
MAPVYAANMPAGSAAPNQIRRPGAHEKTGRANYALHWTCVARPRNTLLAGTPEQRRNTCSPVIAARNRIAWR